MLEFKNRIVKGRKTIEIKIQGIYSLEQILSEAIRVDETHPNIIKKLDIEVLNESESLLSDLDTN